MRIPFASTTPIYTDWAITQGLTYVLSSRLTRSGWWTSPTLLSPFGHRARHSDNRSYREDLQCS